ncbi:MAG: chromate resistance protein ChrB domain-containing protein [Ignavibacteriales bacterium]
METNASFEFAPEDSLPKGSVYFDVYGCEFGYSGEDFAFESLLKIFQVKDKVLVIISQIVHDVDLLYKIFNRPEAKGIDNIVRSLSSYLNNAEKVCEIGFGLLDSLYSYYKSYKNK